MQKKGLGVVHVLTGPDHLGALVTLSAVSDLCTSFFLGVRWGIGHSTGLLLVGIVLIVRDYAQEKAKGDGADEDASAVIEMPDSLSHLFESFVGVFMLCLGFYGLRRALRRRHELQERIILLTQEGDASSTVDDAEPEDGLAIDSYHDEPGHHASSASHSVSVIHRHPHFSHLGPEIEMTDPTHLGGSDDVHGHVMDSSKRISTRTLALFAGVVHGLAGPGGVLGVIPAVQLHDWRLAALYLSCFCVSSTLTMGCFASLYGLCSSSVGKKTNMEFQIHCFSSALSILVGITWLVLLSLGKLEDVFP